MIADAALQAAIVILRNGGTLATAAREIRINACTPWRR